LPDLSAFAAHLKSALAAGDVACLQLRLKDASPTDIKKAAKELMPIAHDYDVAFILNDDPKLAAELNCDGVHIGQQDTPYDAARKSVGNDAIVGVTCHDSRHLAMIAGEKGADYVAFGAFYPTTTKAAPTAAHPDLLSWWQTMMEVPCVAIGGITPENCAPLIAAGADFLAVSSGVWQHPNGAAAAVAAFDRIIKDVFTA
jgi:thiamine-phosphate pyrophosphorylase